MSELQDLELLADPQAVTTLADVQILNEMLDAYRALDPDFDTLLESDPIFKFIEMMAYRETLLRARINYVYSETLLGRATGADLDWVGAFYGVERLPGELDDPFRLRIRARIQGWANAGASAHYKYWAKSVDARVADVNVERGDAAGKIIVTIYSNEAAGDGTAAPELIDLVTAQLNREDIRPVNDNVTVVSASAVDVDIKARITRLPNTSPAMLTDVTVTAIDGTVTITPSSTKQQFTKTFNQASALDFDVTESWVKSQLQITGVYKVELIDFADALVNGTQFPRLRSLELIDGGTNK